MLQVAIQKRSLLLILGLGAAFIGEGAGAEGSNAQNPDPVIVQKIKGLFGVDSGPQTPAGVEKIKLTTGKPQKGGENAYSMTVQWRKDRSLHYEGTGFAIITGPGERKPDDGVTLAKKLVTALREGMLEMYEVWRGAQIEQERDQNGKLLPAVWIQNAPGHSLSHITLRDYTNEELKAEVDPSYQAAGVDAAIDVVLAGPVEFGGFPGLGMANKTKTHEEKGGGTVVLHIGEGQAFAIQTANKEPEQIEKELAERLESVNLKASASGSPLVPDTTDRDVRNVQPFDGSEVQFKGLDASSIQVAVNDPRLGVIMKFRFPDENAAGFASTWGPSLLLVLTGGVVLFVYLRRKGGAAQTTLKPSA